MIAKMAHDCGELWRVAGFCYIKLLQTCGSHSPLTRLFFEGTGLREDPLAIADTQFVPGQGSHTHLLIARAMRAKFKQEVPGVYICSRNCDFLYDLHDCGMTST
jgi:hypothetical protein